MLHSARPTLGELCRKIGTRTTPSRSVVRTRCHYRPARDPSADSARVRGRLALVDAALNVFYIELHHLANRFEVQSMFLPLFLFFLRRPLPVASPPPRFAASRHVVQHAQARMLWDARVQRATRSSRPLSWSSSSFPHEKSQPSS
jgi:hypothetical protein